MNRLQGVMSNLLSENQSAYINNRFTSESSVLIFDVLEITDSLQIDWLLMTIDIEKSSESISISFS